MKRTRAIAAAARRRRIARAFLSAFGRSAVVLSCAALVIAIVDRLIGPGFVWWIWPAGIALGAALIAGAFASRAAGTARSAASEVDHALRLYDSLSSAIELSDDNANDAFALLAQQRAEADAAKVNLVRAIPIRFGRAWITWPAITALAALAAALIPAQHLFTDQRAREQRIEQVAHANQAAADIAQLSDQLKSLSQDENAPYADLVRPDQLEALNNLERELAAGRKSADEARSQAAGVLSDAADQLETSAAETERRAEAVREMFNQTGPTSNPQAQLSEESLEAFRNALSEGNYDSALDALSELDQSLDEMTEQDRVAAALELEQLAEQLEAQSKLEEQQAEQEKQRREQSLRDAGLSDEQIEQLLNAPDSNAAADQLQQQGLDEEAAQRLAEQLEQQKREEEARRDAAQEAQRTSESVKDAAEDVRNPPDSPDSPETPAPSDASKPPASASQERNQQDQQNKDKSPQDDQSGKKDQSSEQGQRDQEKQGEKKPSSTPSTSKDPNAQQGNEKSSQPSPDQNEKSPTGAQPQKDQPNQQSDAPGEEKGEAPTSDPNSPQQQTPDPNQPGPQQPGQQQQPQQQPGAKPDPSGTQRQGTDPNAPRDPNAPQQQVPGAADPNDPNAQEGDQPGMRDDAQPGETPGTPPSPQSMESLRKQLERLRDQSQTPQQQREAAEQMRREAKEMLENMTPQERERLERWARQQQKEQGEDGGAGSSPLGNEFDTVPPGGTSDPSSFGQDFVDARSKGAIDDARPAGQYNDPNIGPDRGAPVSDREMIELLSAAAKEADQAIEDQLVPSRYRNVREYFRKALERAKEAEQQGTDGDGAGNANRPKQESGSAPK